MQVPVYGTRLSAARHLVPLAMTLSQAGVSGCDILHTLTTGLHDPLTPQGHGITLSELAMVSQDTQTLRSVLTLVSSLEIEILGIYDRYTSAYFTGR